MQQLAVEVLIQLEQGGGIVFELSVLQQPAYLISPLYSILAVVYAAGSKLRP